MAEDGWTFAQGEGVIPDPLFNSRALHELYTRADPHYTGRVTVPVLWDQHTQTIVNNESAEIIRMFNSAFDGVGAKPGDYYPEPLRGEIDAAECAHLRHAEQRRLQGRLRHDPGGLRGSRRPAVRHARLAGGAAWHSPASCAATRLTEADIRLFTTLVRFDAVYHGHFKCNIRRIVDYRHLWAYTRDIYQLPGIAPTVNFTHIKRHYYMSHRSINPTGIVPAGPALDFDVPAERAPNVDRLIVF